MLSEPHLDLKPGERILIVGEQSVGTCLFRAIAGLWPWGSGRITFPARQSVVFRPTQPYLPPGVLRASITYPDSLISEASEATWQAVRCRGSREL
jgi:vitamin B12/bleomycin/antimicrobial peptide transport system ATP-binding/permease protein